MKDSKLRLVRASWIEIVTATRLQPDEDSRGLQEPHTLRYTASHTYNKNGGNR